MYMSYLIQKCFKRSSTFKIILIFVVKIPVKSQLSIPLLTTDTSTEYVTMTQFFLWNTWAYSISSMTDQPCMQCPFSTVPWLSRIHSYFVAVLVEDKTVERGHTHTMGLLHNTCLGNYALSLRNPCLHTTLLSCDGSRPITSVPTQHVMCDTRWSFGDVIANAVLVKHATAKLLAYILCYHTSLEDRKPWLADLTVNNHHVAWCHQWGLHVARCH